MSITHSDLKTADFHNFSSDTICSCTEAVEELFQHTLGHECLEQDVNTFSICVYMFIAYSDLKTADFHNFFADTICSCTEAVDELFEHALGHECMEQDINTYYICSYMPIAYSALKRADFHYFSFRYQLQLH